MQQDRWNLTFAFIFATLLPFTALAWDRGEVERFATLPAGNHNPEGITADKHGNIYVTTFDTGRGSEEGRMFVFSRHGELKRVVDIPGSSAFLLDLAFHPITGKLLVIDFGRRRVVTVNPQTGENEVFTTITDLTPGDSEEANAVNPGPNVLTFDKDGNVYISDSFQGIIWRTDKHGHNLTQWAAGSLLQPNGVPPFGANGLAFNKKGDTLFVANTSTDQIIKIPVATRIPEVFVNSVNGADGLIIDKHDNLWICANQADEIVVLEPKQGRVIAKLGDFNGLTKGGAPRGLLFPASLVRVGDWIYVTNLSLNLPAATGVPATAAVDSPWAADVKRHTIARLKAKIRGFDD
jgi:sugar lactone lactonase YvrE